MAANRNRRNDEHEDPAEASLVWRRRYREYLSEEYSSSSDALRRISTLTPSSGSKQRSTKRRQRSIDTTEQHEKVNALEFGWRSIRKRT
jgi:hypothetical protein